MLRTSSADRAYARYRRTGDPNALARLFDATADELLGIAAYLVGNRDRARDLVQQAFLIAIEKREAFDPKRAVVPWLCGMIANLARAERRRRQPPQEPVPDLLSDADPVRAAEGQEFRATLDRIRHELSPTYRPVLDLHLLHGLSAEEIGRVLDRPAGTIRTQIVRGLKLLRQKIPRGFAVGLAAAALSATIQAMREQVIAAAGRAAPTGTGVATGGATVLLVGGSAMKKLVLASGTAALMLVSAWLCWDVLTSVPEGDPSRSPAMRELQGEGAAAPSGAVAAQEGDRRTTVAPAAPSDTNSSTTGAVAVALTWKRDGAPAVRQDVQVVCWSDPHGKLRPRRGLTDAQGRVLLTELPTGSATVQTATGNKQDIEVIGGQTTEIAMTATALVMVKLRVLDPLGAPVSDARIWLASEFSYHRHRALRFQHRAGHGQFGTFVGRSDANGEFAFRANTAQCVAAFKTGYGPSESCYVRRKSGQRGTPTDTITLRLTRKGCSVDLRVRDADGQPIPDAHVVAGTEAPHLTGTSNASATTPALRATTDPEGRCQFEGLPAGRLQMQVRAPGFGPWSQRCELAPNVTNEVLVTLHPGAQVTGTVRDESDRPVADAVVTFGRVGRIRGALAVSGADGRFRLIDLPAGSLELEAWHPKVGEAVAKPTVTAGREHEWNPVLLKRPAITGVVLDTDGNPVPKARLAAYGSSGGAAAAFAGTDARGRFALGPLKRDDVYSVDASFPYHGGGRIRLSRRDVRPETEIELRAEKGMEPTTAIRGRLTRADGSPFTPAAVMILPYGGPGGNVWSVDKEGRFTSLRRPPGRVHVTVSAGMRTIADLGVHDLEAHKPTDLGDIVVPGPGTVQIAIRDREQLAGGVASLYLNGRSYDSLRITAENLHELQLPPGKYRLCVRKGGNTPLAGSTSFSVRTGEISHATFEPKVAHRTTVRFGAGTKGWYELRLHAPDSDRMMRYSTSRMAPGTSERFLLPAGTWRLEVWQRHRKLQAQDLRIPCTNDTLDLSF